MMGHPVDRVSRNRGEMQEREWKLRRIREREGETIGVGDSHGGRAATGDNGNGPDGCRQTPAQRLSTTVSSRLARSLNFISPSF